jgi:hypothetical protein
MAASSSSSRRWTEAPTAVLDIAPRSLWKTANSSRLPTRTRPAWSGRARPSGRRRADPKAWPAHADTALARILVGRRHRIRANRRGSVDTGETTAHDRANLQAMAGRLGKRNVDGKFGRGYAGGPRRRVRRRAAALSPAYPIVRRPSRLASAEARAGFTAAELRDILDSVIEVDAQLTANRRSAMLPGQALPRPSSGSSNISCRCETGQVISDPRSDRHSASTHSYAVAALEVSAARRSGTSQARERIHEYVESLRSCSAIAQ